MTNPADPRRAFEDLLWCVRSPGMIAPDPGSRDTEGSVTWPDDAWFSNQPVVEGAELPFPRHPHHFRLGLHFEKLMHAWLQHHPDMALKAKNLQVNGLERTLGEFDLIVNNQGVTEHWELAVKFYLGVGNCESPAKFHGPNTTDRLDKKLTHLVRHQLQLSLNPNGRALLESRNLLPDLIRGIIKGRLYYPWEMFQAGTFPEVSGINRTHQKGWWIPLDAMQEKSFTRVAYLPKQYWLAPFTGGDSGAVLEHPAEAPLRPFPGPVMDLPALKQFLLEPGTELATHIVLLDNDHFEISRGFVLLPGWFERQSASSGRLTS